MNRFPCVAAMNFTAEGPTRVVHESCRAVEKCIKMVIVCAPPGGLLMVTCTDLAVLCAAYPEKCHAIYGSYPLKTKACHEGALRIALACIESHANRHRRYVVPLLSVHINFYVRLFVRVYTSPSEVKRSPTKLSYLYQCTGCESFAFQPLARRIERNGHEKIVPGQGPPVGRECEHCGKVHHVGGPYWTAPIHDADFVQTLLSSLKEGEGASLASAKRLIGMLTSVRSCKLSTAHGSRAKCLHSLAVCPSPACGRPAHFTGACPYTPQVVEELPDVPLFQQLPHMCSVLHTPVPQTLGVLSALLRQGFRVSRSHTDATAIKTDAPMDALWDVLRCWARIQVQEYSFLLLSDFFKFRCSLNCSRAP